jgi:hypothetical protein
VNFLQAPLWHSKAKSSQECPQKVQGKNFEIVGGGAWHFMQTRSEQLDEEFKLAIDSTHSL